MNGFVLACIGEGHPLPSPFAHHGVFFAWKPLSAQDLKHVFPASRLLLSTVKEELADLSKGYAAFKRLVEGDPNLRPNPPTPEASPTDEAGQAPPSPSGAAIKRSSSSCGGDSDSGSGEGSSPSKRSEKLMSLSRQRTENRKSVATTGKVSPRGCVTQEACMTGGQGIRSRSAGDRGFLFFVDKMG